MTSITEDAVVSTLHIDADAEFRRSTRMLLRANGIASVGEASNVRDAVRLAAELRPDVVLLDADLEGDVVDATQRITALPTTPAVMVLGHGEGAASLDVLVAGARALCARDAHHKALAASVRAVASGETVLSDEVAGRLVVRMRKLEGERSAYARERRRASLSALERDVLTLLAMGEGNTGIGAALHLSSSTVKQHITKIIGKLGVENRVQAAVEGVRIGLV